VVVVGDAVDFADGLVPAVVVVGDIVAAFVEDVADFDFAVVAAAVVVSVVVASAVVLAAVVAAAAGFVDVDVSAVVDENVLVEVAVVVVVVVAVAVAAVVGAAADFVAAVVDFFVDAAVVVAFAQNVKLARNFEDYCYFLHEQMYSLVVKYFAFYLVMGNVLSSQSAWEQNLYSSSHWRHLEIF